MLGIGLETVNPPGENPNLEPGEPTTRSGTQSGPGSAGNFALQKRCHRRGPEMGQIRGAPGSNNPSLKVPSPVWSSPAFQGIAEPLQVFVSAQFRTENR